jgi:hypothetical protein
VFASIAIAVVAAFAVIASGVLGGAGASPRPSTSHPPPSAPAPNPTSRPTGKPIVVKPPVGPSEPAPDPTSRPTGKPIVVKPPVGPSEPAPNPTSRPTGKPIVVKPPVGPSDDASDGVDTVELINLPGVDSWVVVWDESDSLADAWSGTPDRDGPVARDVIETAGSVDQSTIRLTWSDLPIDSRAQLSIRHTSDGKYHFVLFRSTPAGPTDNVVSDRVLYLKFHVAVPVEDVVVELVEGLAPSAGIGLFQGGLTTSSGTGLSVAVWDETDGLAAARIDRVEGLPSVGPDTVLVVNDDDDTLRVTWADPEVATYAKLSIRITDNGRYQLRLVREHPLGPTTPVALERVLVLDFLVAVPADEVDVEVIDTLAKEG